jgi:pentatricopeptide repeat protein
MIYTNYDHHYINTNKENSLYDLNDAPQSYNDEAYNPQKLHITKELPCESTNERMRLDASIHYVLNTEQNTGTIDCLDETRRNFTSPATSDSIAYNVLIKKHAKQGRWIGVDALLRNMTKNRMSPSVDTYNTLIKKASIQGYFERAKTHIREMKRAGHRPTELTYTSLIKIHSLNKNWSECEFFYSKIIKNKLANKVATNILVQNLYDNNEKSKAYDIFYKSEITLDKAIDLHGLGHAVALFALEQKIETLAKARTPRTLSIITGKGGLNSASKHKPYAMRNFIEEELPNSFDYIRIMRDINNDGRLVLSFFMFCNDNSCSQYSIRT